MDSPQKENGYTPVAHKIIEQTCMYNFNASQLFIIMIVWRFTYGFNRKSHKFSLSFLQDATQLGESTVKRELKTLIQSGVLTVVEEATNRKTRILSFNKHFDEWTIQRRGEQEMKGNKPKLEGSDKSTQKAQIRAPKSNENDYLGGSDQSTKKEKELKSLKKSFKENVEVLFDRFYEIYPRKVSKVPAKKAWIKLSKKENFDPDRIIANTLNFAETCKLLGTIAKYIPHPSTYLNQERFHDYPFIDPEGLAAKKKTRFDRNKDLLLGGNDLEGSGSATIIIDSERSLPEPSRDFKGNTDDLG